MADDKDIIRPATAPLSHLETGKRGNTRQDPRIYAVVAAVLLVAVFLYNVTWQVDVESSPIEGSRPTTEPRASKGDGGLAPFASAQRQLTRERAQQSLAKFVETQIELEENMQVAAWGQTELDAALEVAREGDVAFAAERYEEAMALYTEANQAISGVVTRGEVLFGNLLEDAGVAIDDRDHDRAMALLDQALAIKPASADAIAARGRAEKIPEIVRLIRTAKNHELADRYPDALQTYEAIRRIDPLTPGIDELMTQARVKQTGERVAAHITRGFRALESGNFESARKAFQAALALDPTNNIAAGGIEQVGKRNDLAVIATQRNLAEEAMNEENWQQAADAYQHILDLDDNIQFAIVGRKAALQHERTSKLLTAITREPQRLSAQALFLQAEEIVAGAETLTHQGPELKSLIEETRRLLGLYRDPVEVTLISDNATDVVISNLGRVGYFSRKTVTLRPGAYTIRGSQAGCRDLYLTIEVIPGIEPVDLSCQERLSAVAN